MVDLSVLLAANAASAEYDDLPVGARDAAKKLLLNTLAIALAGTALPESRTVGRFIASFPSNQGATVLGLGSGGKVLAPFAAYANATMANMLDFDDNYDPNPVHAGVTVVPPAMAIAEACGPIDGRTLITAIAIGVDAICRLGEGRTSADSMGNQWSSTALLGYFGSALTVAKLLKFDEAQMRNAMGVAHTQLAGNKQSMHDGSTTKATQMGQTAAGGILACMMTEAGIDGPTRPLEGTAGLFPWYYRGDYDPGRVIDALGSEFWGERLSLKPYPSCRHTHGFIDAALQLRESAGFDARNIDSVVVQVCEMNRLVWDPPERKYAPKTTIDAQFSLMYAIASALLRGLPKISHYTGAALEDSDVLDLCRRVSVYVGANPTTRGLPPSKLAVTTLGNELLTRTVTHPKGSPENPMTFDDLRSKTHGCAEFAGKTVDDGRMDELVDSIMNLEDEPDVGRLMGLLT